MSPLFWLTAGGTAVVNADDEAVSGTELGAGVARISFGMSPEAEVSTSRVKTLSRAHMPVGLSFDVQYGQERAHVSLAGVVGSAHIYAALAGVAGALAAGAAFADATRGVGDYHGPPGRMRLIAGDNETVLVDDTYNASPVATEAALNTLATLPRKGRRIAVLGDMLELGPYSVGEHESVGTRAAGAADLIVAVGVRARKIAEGAINAGMSPTNVLMFDRALEAAEHLRGVIEPGDVVLVKGSQSTRMERVVKELMAHPEDAKQLLCRQDAEWLTR